MKEQDERVFFDPLRVKEPMVFLTLFWGTALFITVDLVSDFWEGGEPIHLGLEMVGALLSVLGGTLVGRRLWRDFVRTRQELDQTQVRVDTLLSERQVLKQEAAHWRSEAQELLAGLGEAIDVQFERWSLSTAEREVGLLLLKGLSFKEVAAVRHTAEKTGRQQARALYKKSGLAGRAELSAFFLEDLLLPRSSS